MFQYLEPVRKCLEFTSDDPVILVGGAPGLHWPRLASCGLTSLLSVLAILPRSQTPELGLGGRTRPHSLTLASLSLLWTQGNYYQLSRPQSAESLASPNFVSDHSLIISSTYNDFFFWEKIICLRK